MAGGGAVVLGFVAANIRSEKAQAHALAAHTHTHTRVNTHDRAECSGHALTGAGVVAAGVVVVGGVVGGSVVVAGLVAASSSQQTKHPSALCRMSRQMRVDRVETC